LALRQPVSILCAIGGQAVDSLFTAGIRHDVVDEARLRIAALAAGSEAASLRCLDTEAEMFRKLMPPTAALLLSATTAFAADPASQSRNIDTRGGVSLARSDGAAVPLPVARPNPGHRLVSDGASAAGGTLKSDSPEAVALQLEGARVVSSDGEVVGEVERVIAGLDTDSHAVVSVGGLLGLGASRVLMPTRSLTPSGAGTVRAAMTAERIRGLPAHKD